MKALRKYWNENNKKVKKKNIPQKKSKTNKKIPKQIEKNIENLNNIKEENKNRNSKNNNQKSIINSEELNQITKKLEEININEKNNEDSNGTLSDEEDYLDTNKKDNLEEIKQDFLSNKDEKDFLNERGKINNNKYNFYTIINWHLNNKNNPFIEANKILNSEKEKISELENYNLDKIHM